MEKTTLILHEWVDQHLAISIASIITIVERGYRGHQQAKCTGNNIQFHNHGIKRSKLLQPQ
eukprot:scaffold12172_cov78-Skeletonema_dohrnii-CCMP3373.AAC.2